MKVGPPGWEPHKITTRIDGWVVDPVNEDRVPAAVAAMMARAMPQPTEIEVIRARMLVRQRMMERRYDTE